MTKLVYANLNPKRSERTSVGRKRVVGADGRLKDVYTLDANSSSFGDGLQFVFAKNVTKARRANKRLLGFVDVAARKP